MWKGVSAPFSDEPPDQQIAALAAELATLRQRQSALESRLEILEARDTHTIPTRPPPLPQAFVPSPITYPPPPPPDPQAPPPLPQAPLETRFGLNWINRIAVITLMLGTAFLFKYGVDNGWINTTVRVVLGILAALTALGAGERLAQKQRAFAQGLTGLGLGLLYLSLWAASSLYELMPVLPAFLFMWITTGMGGFLARRYDSQMIALLGMLGGYLTPAVLSTGDDRPWTLFSYLFVINLGFLFSARSRGWKLVVPFALIATSTFYAAWGLQHFSAANRTVATLFAFLFYAQFVATGSGFAWWAVQFLVPLALAMLWDRQARFLPYEVLLAATGLAAAEWRKWHLAPSWTLACFWIPYGIWINAYGPDGIRGWTFAWLCGAFVLFFLWVPWCTLWHPRRPRIGDLTMAAANAVLYFAASYALLNPVRHSYMGLLALVVAGVHLGLTKALWKTEASLATSAIALTFATLAVPIQFTGFRISMAWALEGAALAWLAAQFRNRWFSGASGIVMVLMILRLTADANAAFNARFLTFVVAALCLWLAAKFTFDAWPESPIAPGVAYTVGHLLLLVGNRRISGEKQHDAVLLGRAAPECRELLQ